MKNPNFANTATIFAYAKTSSEVTTTSFQLYFRASRIKRIELIGTPEVIATNGSKAKITAIAFDTMGNRVKDERISFNMLSGPGGGEYLDPPTSITAEDGSAITYLVSGKTPSMFREVWITAGDLYAQKSDTIKFTIAGPPHAITIRENLKEGIDFGDGTFGLPVASIVTDVNGNPVADGTEVTFSLKVTGWVVHRPISDFSVSSYYYWCAADIDTLVDIYPFEDLNDNYLLDPGEDINGDGFASRGEDIDGDGKLITGPAYEDINKNGRRDYVPGVPGYQRPEPYQWCYGYYDSTGRWVSGVKPIYKDYNGNGKCDSIAEPLIGTSASLTDQQYTDSLNQYKLAHHDANFDLDSDPKNGVADPRTAIVISRTVQTAGGKATNQIMYGQSDAVKIEVTIWAESQGVRTLSPAKFVLQAVGGIKE